MPNNPLPTAFARPWLRSLSAPVWEVPLDSVRAVEKFVAPSTKTAP
jgi:hypothetical protein